MMREKPRRSLVPWGRLWHGAALSARSPSLSARAFFEKIRRKMRREGVPRLFLFDNSQLSACLQHHIHSFSFSRDEIAAATHSAESSCNHTLNLLGAREYFSHAPLPWSQDYRFHFDWGFDTPSHEIRIGDPDGTDIKVPWELSRFYHLPNLAIGYRETKKEQFLTEIIDEISDWIEKNQFGFGPNWMNAMEVGIRAANWCVTIDLIKPLLSLRNKGHVLFLRKVCQSLMHHGYFIENNIEYGPISSNHYLADMVGLLYLAVFFSPINKVRRWLRLAVHGLNDCMNKQVLSDGVYFESSTSYHRLATELFGYAALLTRTAGVALSPDYEAKLKKMFTFSMQYMDHGYVPQFGDTDNGRLHTLGEDLCCSDMQDHSHLRSLYGRIFPTESGFVQSTTLFPCGKIAIMRSDHLMVFANARDNGQGGNGGHCHNDILSFELTVKGNAAIIDTGTGCYTSNKELRNIFRSTRMHNTVAVDHQEQNRIPPPSEGVFWMHRDASTRILKWDSNELHDHLIAEHTGFCRLPDPVIHRRGLYLNKELNHLLIHDEFLCKREHEFEWNFHLAPHAEVFCDGRSRLRIVIDDCVLFCDTDQRAVIEITTSPYSPSYGVISKSPTIRCSWRGVPQLQPFEFRFSVDCSI